MLAPGTIEAFGLYLTRSSAMVIAAPILGAGTRFAGHRIALIFATALLMYGVTGAPLAESDAVLYGAMMLRELLIGLFLSFVMHLALLAVQVAGHMVSQEMGFLLAQQVDPATGVQTPLISSIYESLFLLALLALNGHFLLFHALAASFREAPVGGLALGPGFGGVAADVLGDMFEAGIAFAAPVMALLFLASLLIGLLSRAVPHLNILEVGFSIRILLALVALAVFAPLLAPAMEDLYAAFGRALERSVAALGG